MPDTSNPDEPVKVVTDPVLGYSRLAMVSSLKKSDYPNLDPEAPVYEDGAGVMHNLTPAQMSAGEVGTSKSQYPSSHTLTLMGGGVPGSIFAATVDGMVVYESIYEMAPRNLSQVATSAANLLMDKLPYLRCTPSGSSVFVESMKPTLTISSPPSSLGIQGIQIYLGQAQPAAGDYVNLTFQTTTQTFRVSQSFNGTELVYDQALNKLLLTLQGSGLEGPANIRTYFIGDPALSYIEISAWKDPLVAVYGTNTGQIRLRMNPMTAGPNNFTFTVS